MHRRDTTNPDCSYPPSWPCYRRARDIPSPVHNDISSRYGQGREDAAAICLPEQLGWSAAKSFRYQYSLFLVCKYMLPDRLPEGCRILVMDPMLATGGTMIAAINLLKNRGAKVKQIRVISAVTCPYGIEKLGRKFPGIQVYVAAVDHVLNEKGYMIPGLGDAGDRCYGTEPVVARGWLVKS